MAEKDYSVLPKKSKKEKKMDIEQRVCRLIRLMLTLDKGVLNLDRAAQDCGINKRTIQRDLKVLEAAGIPLYKPVQANSNYVLEPDFRFFHYHITPENLENFLHTTIAMLQFSQQPFDLLNPVQKEVLHMAEKDGEERKKILDNISKNKDINTTAEQFNGLLLQGKTSLTDPLVRLQQLFLVDTVLTDIEDDRHFGYGRLQLAEMRRMLAHMARISRDYKAALKHLKCLLKNDPKDAWAYGEMAFVYYEMGDIDSAIQTLQTGCSKTHDGQLTLYLAFLLGEAKKYTAAIQCFKKIYSDPALVLSFSAEMHKRAGELELALQKIEQAISLSANN